MYQDREEAGRLLGEHLRGRVRAPALVLGIPRGGVLVAAPVASALAAPLDVILPRKIGAPGEPELALGALALASGQEILIFDEPCLSRLGVTREQLAPEVERQRKEIGRRALVYSRDPPPDPRGRTIVIVDDGIATGLTARAAGKAAQRLGGREVIVAAPVAPPEALREFAKAGLRLEVLETPHPFMAVGQFYQDFHAVEDDEVLSALGRGPKG